MKAKGVAAGTVATITRIFGERARKLSVSVVGRSVEIESDERMTVTFEDLQALSDAFGTREIDIRYYSGWGGSDVTPGDPDEFTIEIHNPTKEP